MSLVRDKKRAPQWKMTQGQPTPKVPAMPFTFPAPTLGWVLSENLAMPPQASARVLDNWVCTTTGIRARGGNTLHATLGAAATRLFAYRSGTVEKLFGATGTAVYDITSPADPEVAPTADLTSQTSGAWSTTMFGVAGGDFLIAVNGADAAQEYDGGSWASLSVTGVTPSDLSYVWPYANRLFFIEKNTLKFWYLPAAAKGGAANSFSLAGVFRRGGSLLFGATWSSDSGAGLDDRLVLVTTEGEVAVYQGVDPASDFQLVGVYDMPKPLGPDAHMNAGGDLLIATEVGLIPISAAVQSDVAALSQQAFSRAIAPYWQDRARALSVETWEMAKVTNKNILVVTQPGEENLLCVNLQTGAWSRWTGIQNECIALYNDQAYAGDSSGRVVILDNGGSDRGAIYTARYLGQFEALGAPGITKTVRQANMTFQSGSNFTAQLTFKADFDETAAAPPNAADVAAIDVWDVAEWDVGVWDANSVVSVASEWRAVGATGRYLAPDLQISFGSAPAPVVELVSIDAQFHVGEMVT